MRISCFEAEARFRKKVLGIAAPSRFETAGLQALHVVGGGRDAHNQEVVVEAAGKVSSTGYLSDQ